MTQSEEVYYLGQKVERVVYSQGRIELYGKEGKHLGSLSSDEYYALVNQKTSRWEFEK